MAKLAVDIVLLPEDIVMNKCFEINRILLRESSGPIVFDQNKCLPHISLAMGCVDEICLNLLKSLLKKIIQDTRMPELKINEICTVGRHCGFRIGKNKEIQNLHERVMIESSQFFNYNIVEKNMFFNPDEIDESVVAWVKNFPQDSSFKNFSPHITLGFGNIQKTALVISFTTPKIAVCHLGSDCTCRKILAQKRFKR